MVAARLLVSRVEGEAVAMSTASNDDDGDSEHEKKTSCRPLRATCPKSRSTGSTLSQFGPKTLNLSSNLVLRPYDHPREQPYLFCTAQGVRDGKRRGKFRLFSCDHVRTAVSRSSSLGCTHGRSELCSNSFICPPALCLSGLQVYLSQDTRASVSPEP